MNVTNGKQKILRNKSSALSITRNNDFQDSNKVKNYLK